METAEPKLKVLCPKCLAKLSAGREHFGQQYPCPRCSGTVSVPDVPDGASPSEVEDIGLRDRFKTFVEVHYDRLKYIERVPSCAIPGAFDDELTDEEKALLGDVAKLSGLVAEVHRSHEDERRFLRILLQSLCMTAGALGAGVAVVWAYFSLRPEETDTGFWSDFLGTLLPFAAIAALIGCWFIGKRGGYLFMENLRAVNAHGRRLYGETPVEEKQATAFALVYLVIIGTTITGFHFWSVGRPGVGVVWFGFAVAGFVFSERFHVRDYRTRAFGIVTFIYLLLVGLGLVILGLYVALLIFAVVSWVFDRAVGKDNQKGP